MPYINPAIHPLYRRTISKPLSAATLSQLRRYCHRVLQEEVWTGWAADPEYIVHMYGLRENCRVLVEMLVLPHA